jgi:hypothetical protein
MDNMLSAISDWNKKFDVYVTKNATLLGTCYVFAATTSLMLLIAPPLLAVIPALAFIALRAINR